MYILRPVRLKAILKQTSNETLNNV